MDDLATLVVALAGAGQGVLRARLRDELGAKAGPRFVALALRMLGLEAEESNAIAAETAKRFNRRPR